MNPMPEQAADTTVNFTVKLAPQLRDDFQAEAQALNRPASQLLQELMTDFLEHRAAEHGQYQAFLERKVSQAAESLHTHPCRSTDEVRADTEARRARARARAGL